MAKSKSKPKVKENEFQLLNIDDALYKTFPTLKFLRRKSYSPRTPNLIKAQIPGIIGKIYVNKGDEINENDKLLELEAMKMYNQILSPIKGIVSRILVSTGEKVAKEQLLIEIEPFLQD